MSLRLIPGLQVIRPADASETVEAWLSALENKNGPTALILTRQKLPEIHESGKSIKDFKKGAFVVKESKSTLDAVVLATGSEVSISLEAAKELEKESINLRVVSVPCLEGFLKQEQSYLEQVIPMNVPVVTVEAGRTMGWGNVCSAPTLHIGIDHFGASGPYEVLAEKFGFTAKAVYNKIKDWLPKVRA